MWRSLLSLLLQCVGVCVVVVLSFVSALYYRLLRYAKTRPTAFFIWCVVFIAHLSLVVVCGLKMTRTDPPKKSTPIAVTLYQPPRPPSSPPSIVVAKKNTPPKKEVASKPKPKPKPKTKPKPKAKPKPKVVKKKVQKDPVAKKSPSTKEMARIVEELRENVEKIALKPHKGGGKKAEKRVDLEVPELITALQTEQGDPRERKMVGDAGAEYQQALIFQLQAAIELPEHGSVGVQLTVARSGEVSAVAVTAADRDRNRRYVESTLPSCIFPPFQHAFVGEEEHTFLITLTSDL